MTPLLTLEHVSKRSGYGRRERATLVDISLQVMAGQIVGVWGARGSGRDMLLRLAAGIEQPDSGVVSYDGVSLADASFVGQGIGLVQSSFLRGEGETIVDFVATPLLATGTSRRVARIRALETLIAHDQEELAFLAPGDLEPFERIAVGVVRALMGRPRMLLLDVPELGGTDGAEILGLLREVSRGGVSILVTSEDLGIVTVAQQIMVLGDGRLIRSDRSGHVIDFPKRPAQAG